MQSQGRCNRVQEKFPEKVPGSLGANPSQVQRGQEKVAEQVSDQRLFRYTEHAHSLPAVNPIGTVTNELCNDWHREDFPSSAAYFLCTLSSNPQ